MVLLYKDFSNIGFVSDVLKLSSLEHKRQIKENDWFRVNSKITVISIWSTSIGSTKTALSKVRVCISIDNFQAFQFWKFCLNQMILFLGFGLWYSQIFIKEIRRQTKCRNYFFLVSEPWKLTLIHKTRHQCYICKSKNIYKEREKMYE